MKTGARDGRNAAGDRPLTDRWGVYLHIPFCDRRCPYCAFYSVSAAPVSQIDALLRAIDGEARRRLNDGTASRRATSVYIGGGTPSYLSVAQLQRLCGIIRRWVDPGPDVEWSVECNPGSIDGAKLAVLKAAGVNRISLGGQSLDDRVLCRLGRRHRVADIQHAVDAIGAAGFANWNLDLIACVPGVGPRRWDTMLGRAVALCPSHLSVYELTLDEGRRLVDSPDRRPPRDLDAAAQLRMLHLTRERLARAGYRRYEISNYARQGYRCRHHDDFWAGGDYLGLGPSAVSRVGSVQRRNCPDLDGYLRALRAGRDAPHDGWTVTDRERLAERLIIGLRRMEGVGWTDVRREFGLAPGRQTWPYPVLRQLTAYGLMQRKRDRLVLTERGLDLADAVALELWPSSTPDHSIR